MSPLRHGFTACLSNARIDVDFGAAYENSVFVRQKET